MGNNKTKPYMNNRLHVLSASSSGGGGGGGGSYATTRSDGIAAERKRRRTADTASTSAPASTATQSTQQGRGGAESVVVDGGGVLFDMKGRRMRYGYAPQGFSSWAVFQQERKNGNTKSSLAMQLAMPASKYLCKEKDSIKK